MKKHHIKSVNNITELTEKLQVCDISNKNRGI